ncbi:MAG TPA: V-type ATP synthase subunit E family protein [Anaerolineaceae bacterium]|jgi:vacuolar-type H+-ATPase subunit E/Vma4
MKSVEENIEALSRAMLSEAKAEAELIKTDAQAKADAIRQKAQAQAAGERSEILDRARQEAERLRGQVVATTQMKARTLELDHREKLLQSVFTSALQELHSVEQWNNYQEIALSLVREALLQLNSNKMKIRVDEYTKKFLTDQVLEEISKELKVHVSFGKPLDLQGTGVIVETDDGHLQFDNTLETRLTRLQNTLRSPVYRILIGETI